MRTCRLAPTVAATVLFLVAANLLLVWLLPEASPAGRPDEEAWLIYFAVIYQHQPPASLDGDGLGRMLRTLHPDAEAVAGRFRVVSYTAGDDDFELRVEHDDGTGFRITRAGVGGG